MEHDFLWTDNKSPKKTNKKANCGGVMLKNVTTIGAVRGQYDLLHKTDLNDENYGRLDILKKQSY